YPREQELRTLGMPQTLINLIKSQIKTGTITVQCEPVECQVSINDEAVGSTFASVLTKSQVMAGAVKAKVTALNVETQIADVQLSAGQHLNIPNVTMHAPKGALNVTCDPVDCSLHRSGPDGFVTIATTAQQRFSIDNL